MEPINQIIYIISGKARHGKDTIAKIIENYYVEKQKKAITIHYSDSLKEYAKRISGWDGLEATKPRSLLQQLSTKIIRKQIDSSFFLNRTIEDIKVYSYFFEAIIIADARIKHEISLPKKQFSKVITIRVERPNFDNGLSKEEQEHITEVDLDDYGEFDYIVVNDNTVDALKMKIYEILREVESCEKINK